VNEQERVELEWLKRRQERLEQELALLGKQVQAFESRISKPTPEPAKAPEPTPGTGLRPSEIPREEVLPVAEWAKSTAMPPPIPPIIPPEPVVAAMSASEPQPVVAEAIEPERIAPATPPPIPLPPFVTAIPAMQGSPVPEFARTKAAPEKSFEMRLGTYWLVRIGIVMFLTGLVFFGNLAYHTLISKLGPGGKVTLLYLASGMLLGAGAWWQRKAVKESLKNYAQVLFAGGLAAVYFTTYAAHHIEQLKVIQSAGTDGVLLLIWAGFMVWIADHKKSEVLALFAILLAYYTAIISHEIGLFTLYSNLVLTLAAVFFLVRNRWATLSFASLVATYAAYAFWRFLHNSEWGLPHTEDGLWTGTYFLISYWVVFTAAVFLSKDQKFSGNNRSSFLTLNNGAFFTLFLLTMWQVHSHGFWKFSLIYGITLILLSELARVVLPGEPLSKNSYLTQGLLLGTIGLISNPHLAGLNLALILAAESVTLLMVGHQRKSIIMLTGAYIAAALGVGWGMDGMLQHENHGLWLGMGLGAVMLGDALLVDRETRSATGNPLRPGVSYFIVLALVIWGVATWNNSARENFTLVLAAEAALLIFSIYLLQVREVTLLGWGYLAIAQIIWVFDAFDSNSSPPWWNPVMWIVLALGLSEWWRRQKVLELSAHSEPEWKALNQLPVSGKNLILLGGAVFALRFADGWDSGFPGTGMRVYLPMLIGALMLADTLLAHHRTASENSSPLRWQPSYSTALALIIWLVVTWYQTSLEGFPLVLATEGVLLTLSFYLLRVSEVSLLSQAYLMGAQVFWLYRVLDGSKSPPWWNPALLIGLTLGISHWWQKQKVLSVPAYLARFWQGLYSLAIIGLIYYWLAPQVQAANWLALTSVLAIGVTAYGVFTRSWFLAAFGQFFLLVSAVQFAWQLVEGKPDWSLALSPVIALVFLALATVKWFERKPDANPGISRPLLQLALVYRCVALLMSIWWVCKYIPARERIWVLVSLNLLLFLLAGWRRNRETLFFSAAFAFTGLAIFWLPLEPAPKIYLPNLLTLLALLAQQAVAKRRPEEFRLDQSVHAPTIVLGGLSLWRLLSMWIEQIEVQAGGVVSYQTAGWSVLALVFFVVAFLLHERVYRWLGLAVLACALGRVTVIDVWKLKTIYRVLSFMALGLVLLVLGFLYNKYQEKIREWL
jgi:uncharacterized membrane protein